MIDALKESEYCLSSILPQDWNVCRLNDIFTIQQGKALSKKYRTGKCSYPFLRTANVLWGKLELSSLDHMDFQDDEREKYQLIKGDLLICEGGDIGRTAIWQEELHNCYYQNHIHRLRAKNSDIEPRFYMYWMQVAIKLLRLYEGEGNITTIANLSKTRLGNFVVPLPPLVEQQNIAMILSCVQKAIEVTEKVISATKELKKSLMQYLFTYGPVPIDQADQVPLKETEIGLIPEHWEVVKLEDVTIEAHQLNPSTMPDNIIRYVDVSSVSSEKLKITGYKIYPGVDAPTRARKVIITGDVIFATIRPYLRRVAIVPETLDGELCSTAFCVLRANKSKITSKFLFYSVIRDNFIKSASMRQRGSSYPAITDKDVKGQKIALPPLEEQRQIGRILKCIDNKIEMEIDIYEALEILFKSMLHHLMTGKIRVKDIELPEGIGVI